jgi:hypothetical protein
MKSYIPNNRHTILDMVLQYDSEKKEVGKPGFFTDAQRFLINQERAKIMRGDDSLKQNEYLEILISSIVLKIRSGSWRPEKPIQYQ